MGIPLKSASGEQVSPGLAALRLHRLGAPRSDREPQSAGARRPKRVRAQLAPGCSPAGGGRLARWLRGPAVSIDVRGSRPSGRDDLIAPRHIGQMASREGSYANSRVTADPSHPSPNATMAARRAPSPLRDAKRDPRQDIEGWQMDRQRYYGDSIRRRAGTERRGLAGGRPNVETRGGTWGPPVEADRRETPPPLRRRRSFGPGEPVRRSRPEHR